MITQINHTYKLLYFQTAELYLTGSWANPLSVTQGTEHNCLMYNDETSKCKLNSSIWAIVLFDL